MGADTKLTPKLKKENIKQELSFIKVNHPHDMFCISVKYHDNISKGIQVKKKIQNHN